MGDIEILRKFPSLYDYFYYDKWVLEKLCNFQDIKDFIKQQGK